MQSLTFVFFWKTKGLVLLILHFGFPPSVGRSWVSCFVPKAQGVLFCPVSTEAGAVCHFCCAHSIVLVLGGKHVLCVNFYQRYYAQPTSPGDPVDTGACGPSQNLPWMISLRSFKDGMGEGVTVRNRVKAEVRPGNPCRRQSQLETELGGCLERRDLVGIKNMLSYVLCPIKWARKCVMQFRISI